jgi:hypothetical protein
LLTQQKEIAGGKKLVGDADDSFAQDGKVSKAMVQDKGFACQPSLMLLLHPHQAFIHLSKPVNKT